MTSNPKRPPLRSLEHRRFVRSFPCTIFGRSGRHGLHRCSGPIQAAHIRIGTGGGTGFKPGDNFTIPLCVDAHIEQHRGERSFEREYSFNGLKIAADLWARSPARIKMERGNEH